MVRHLSRRGVGKGLLAAGALLAAPGVARAQARELVVVGFGGALDDPYKRIAQQMQERHRGLTVRIVPGISAEALAQIRAARGASPYDATCMEAPAILNGAAEGVLERYDRAQLANARNLEERFLPEAHGWGTPAFYTVIGIAYNRQMIPQPPQSWEDLWKPEYRGKIGLARPQSNLGLAVVALAARMFGGSDDNLEPGLRKWRELNPVVARTPALLTQMMERSEIGLCALWHNNTAIAASRGLPFGFVKPRPGPLVLASSGVLFINSGVKDMALDFINSMIDPQNQAFAAQPPYYFGPTVRGVALPEGAAPFMPATPAEVASVQVMDWAKLAPLRGPTVDAFDRMFAG
jgi:putative spermidine/putrescine transport system substrate-binding protein